MNFLNNARRKVEEAVNEVRATAQAALPPSPSQPAASSTGQPQYSPPPQQWQQQQNSTPQNFQWGNSQAPVQNGHAGFYPPPTLNLAASSQGPPQPAQNPQWNPSSVQTEQPSFQTPRPQSGGPPVHAPQWSQSHFPAPQSSFYPPPPQTIGGPSQSPPRNMAPPPPQQSFPSEPNSLKCLGREPKLTKYSQFFVLKASDSFGACSNCYRSKVLPHQGLAYEFKPYQTINDETRFLCDFSYPSAHAIFKSQCIPRNTVQPLLDFVNLVEPLAACDGSVINTPGPYYTTRLQAIPGFAICPTCFELFLRHTPFEDKFESILDGTHGGTQEWTCDLAAPFYSRLLTGILENETPDFASFVEESNTRMGVPPCPGPGKPITVFVGETPGLVFTAKNGKTGNLCFACYCDCVSNTLLDEAFVPARLNEEQLGKVSCDLGDPYSKVAMGMAIKKGDDEVWRDIVSKLGKVGECRGKAGTDEAFAKEKEQSGDLANWYFLNEAPSIEICPHCYWLKAKLFGAEHLFSPLARPAVPPRVHMCFLTGSVAPPDTSTDDPNNFEDSMAWRGRRLFNSLYPGQAGDWSPLVAVGNAIANELPPCGGVALGFKRASGRKWFGRIRQNSADPDDCTLAFCEECHSRAVKGKPHEAHYSNDLTESAYAAEDTTGFVCQTYTNRSRVMLRQAAQTGNFAEFARWWNHRDELRKKKDLWKPLIQQQLLKMQMANVQQTNQMMLKMNAQRNALQAIGSAGIVEAAMSDTGERWGNSQVGTDHWTKASADAEQQWQNASNMKVGSAAGDFGLMGETQKLFIMSQRDEDAFAAVE